MDYRLQLSSNVLISRSLAERNLNIYLQLTGNVIPWFKDKAGCNLKKLQGIKGCVICKHKGVGLQARGVMSTKQACPAEEINLSPFQSMLSSSTITLTLMVCP